MAFVVKKNLTLPLFKFIVGDALYLKITGPIYVGKELKAKAGETKKKEPAHLCNVTNLETGESGQIIVNAVLRSTLTEEYTNDSYVGKCFQIVKNEREKGKEYDKFSIAEIEDPSAQPAPAAEAPAANVAEAPAANVAAMGGSRRSK